MASQENNLDNLLNDIDLNADLSADTNANEEAINLDRLIADETEIGSILDVLGEEDIEKMLAENQNASEAGMFSEAALEEADLMALLNGSTDADSQDIQDMLKKDENKELLDEVHIPEMEDVVAGLNLTGDGEEENVSANGSTKVSKAEERKRLRQEKIEAKRQQKEAKKAAKEAAKAEKAAAKAAKAQKKTTKGADVAQNNISNEDSNVMDSLFGGNIENLANLGDLSELHSMEPEDTLAIANEMDLFLGSAEEDTLPVVDLEAESAALDEIKDKKQKKEKKGFFGKILDFLTEEDEEEEKENENIRLSEENQEILKEMDKEKGKKKAKKSKKKKAAKGGASEEVTADGAEDAEKEGKKKKEKKPKKEKKARKEKDVQLEEVTEGKPEKKLSLKRILPIIMFSVTLTVAIILLSNLLSDFSTKKAGRQAYYDGDYQTCYQNLHGRKLNESEQVMYGKSESILRIRLWMKEYELFAKEEDHVRALDSLIQSVHDYPTLYSYASEWNASDEVGEIYAQMLAILSEEYELTEAQALEIAAEPSDITYTRIVTAIAGGSEYGAEADTDDTANDKAEATEELKDVLPEEEGLDSTNFIDNNK